MHTYHVDFAQYCTMSNRQIQLIQIWALIGAQNELENPKYTKLLKGFIKRQYIGPYFNINFLLSIMQGFKIYLEN